SWLSDEVKDLVRKLAEVRQPKVLLLNKIDLVPREKLLGLAAEANAALPFEQTFMISALSGDGVDAFVEYLAGEMPPGPWLYPEDEISDVPIRGLAAEITREKIFERLHQELPYQTTVETERWNEQR